MSDSWRNVLHDSLSGCVTEIVSLVHAKVYGALLALEVNSREVEDRVF